MCVRTTKFTVGLERASERMREVMEDAAFIDFMCPHREDLPCGSWCPAFLEDEDGVTLVCFPRFVVLHDRERV